MWEPGAHPALPSPCGLARSTAPLPPENAALGGAPAAGRLSRQKSLAGKNNYCRLLVLTSGIFIIILLN